MSRWPQVCLLLTMALAGSPAQAADPATPDQVARQVDRLIEAEIKSAGGEVAPLTTDDDFLRRVTLDLAGNLPTPRDVTLFALDPSTRKRSQLVSRLLDASSFSVTQARYWRDVIFSRATDQRSRLMLPVFQQWMTEQFENRVSWDKIVTQMLVATGDVRENGAAALLFAQGGEAAELAAETSRIFLGIQIQCANCHDHPTDRWKRAQFHQLAAFFPRVRVRPVRDSMPRTFEVVSLNTDPRGRRRNVSPQTQALFFRRLDSNRDNKLVASEVADSRLARVFPQLLSRADKNKDGGLSLKEFQGMTIPENANRRFEIEHYMPNLDDPDNRGPAVRPVFFATGGRASDGLDDVQRRTLLAHHVTSRSNPWFARAYVNRTWSVLLGQGFAMPIDDMGPEREVAHPETFDLLCQDFVESGYNTRRLFEIITNTRAYQRRIRYRDPTDATPPFAAAEPSRLRGDQIYSALLTVLGVEDSPGRRRPLRGGGSAAGMMARRRAAGRTLFVTLFGFDPSTPQEDITGNVPQSLFLMNSPLIHGLVRAGGNSKLAHILQKHPDNSEAISEVYLLVLAREPSASELGICRDYIAEVGDRGEAFEDLMWSLINSSEFLSKR